MTETQEENIRKLAEEKAKGEAWKIAWGIHWIPYFMYIAVAIPWLMTLPRILRLLMIFIGFVPAWIIGFVVYSVAKQRFYKKYLKNFSKK